MQQELVNEILELLDALELSVSEESQEFDDYASTVKAMLVEELEAEIAVLRSFFDDPESFEDAFKIRCAQRELEFEMNFSFQQLADSPSNQLYWQIAHKVFEPKTMKEMLGILLPNVKCQLRADVQYTIKNRPKAELSLAEEQLTAIDKLEPDQKQFSQFCFADDLLFNVQDLALFPLALQAQLQSQLSQNYPKLAHSLYQHNLSLKKLSDDISTLNNKGKTPKVALEELMQALTIAGERMTGAGYASSGANDALNRFFAYFKALDNELQIQLRALTTHDESISLGKIIDSEIEKGQCVETTSTHLHDVLQNNAHNPILTSSPGLSDSAFKELTSEYGPKKPLDTQKNNPNLQAIPSQLLQKVLSQVELSLDDLVNLLERVPVSFYDSLWQNVMFAKPNKLLVSLFGVVKQGFFNLEQKQSLAVALVKHYPRFKCAPLLFHALRTDDLDFYQAISSCYTKAELEGRLQEIWNKDTIFTYAAFFKSSTLIDYLIELYPPSKLPDTLKVKDDDNDKTLLHSLKSPKLVQKVLDKVDPGVRLELFQIKNGKGNTVLHRNIKYPEILKIQMESLPAEDRVKAAYLKNSDGIILLRAAIEAPKAFAAIFGSLSQQDSLAIYEDQELENLFEQIEEKPETLQQLVKGLPEKNSKALVAAIINDEPRFQTLMNKIPEKGRLNFVLTKIGDETLLDYLVQENVKALKILALHLSKEDLGKALQTKDKDGKILLVKIVNEPEILAQIIVCLSKDLDDSEAEFRFEQAYFYAMLEDSEGKILLDYIDNKASFKFFYAYLSAEQRFNALTFKSQKGESVLFNALKNPEILRYLVKDWDLDILMEYLLDLVDKNNKSLLDRAITEDNDALIKILLKPLTDELRHMVLLNTKIHDGNFLLYCLQSEKLYKLIPIKLILELTPQTLLEVLLVGFILNRELFNTIVSRLFKNLNVEELYKVLTFETREGKRLLNDSLRNLKFLEGIIENLYPSNTQLKILYTPDIDDESLSDKVVKTNDAALLESLIKHLTKPARLVFLQTAKVQNTSLLSYCLNNQKLNPIITKYLPEEFLLEQMRLGQINDLDAFEIIKQLSPEKQFSALNFKVRNLGKFLFKAQNKPEVAEEFIKKCGLLKILDIKDDNNEHLLQKAVQSKNVELVELILNYLPKLRFQHLQATYLRDGKNLLQHCLQNEKLLQLVSKYLPQQSLLEAILLEFINEPKAFNQLFKQLFGQETLTLNNNENLLYNGLKNLSALELITKNLPTDNAIQLLEIEKHLELLLKTLPEQTRFMLLEKAEIQNEITLLDYSLQNQGLFKLVSKYLSQQNLVKILLTIVKKDPKLLKELFNCFPTEQRLKLALVKIGKENLLTCAAKRNNESLTVIFESFSEQDLEKALYYKDGEEAPFLFQILKDEELIQRVFHRLSKKAYSLIMLECSNGNRVVDYSLLYFELSSFQNLFNYLTEEEQFNALVFKNSMGVSLLSFALKNLITFESLFKILSNDNQMKLIDFVDEDNETLLHKAIKDKGSKLAGLLIKYLPDENFLNLLQNPQTHAGLNLLPQILGSQNLLNRIVQQMQKAINENNAELFGTLLASLPEDTSFNLLQNHQAQDGKTLLHQNNLNLLKVTSKYLPKFLINIVLTKTQNNQNLELHELSPESLKIILEQFDHNDRQVVLAVENNMGQNLVHLATFNPKLLEIISPYLSQDSQLVQKKDHFGNTALRYLMFTQQPEKLTEDLPKESTLLLQLYQAVDRAYTDYINHHNNRNDKKYQRNYESGYLSFWRHGQDGVKRAQNFHEAILEKRSIIEIIDKFDNLFTTANAYHTHSFTSYLLDEINEILIVNKEEAIKSDETGHYSKDKWLEAKRNLGDICANFPGNEKKII